MIRIREDERLTVRNQKIGVDYIRNFAPNAPAPNPASYSEFPSPRNADFSDGIRRSSMDELHGSPPYQTGGMLFLYRLLVPAYAVQSGSKIVGRRLPNGSYGSIVQTNSTDYRMVYEGGFSKSILTLPSYVTSLGSAETIRRDTDVSSYVNPDDMSSLGNVAYGKLRPKVEKLTLLQDVLEAKEIPSMLKTTSKGFHELWQACGGSNPAWRAHSVKRWAAENWKQTPKKASDQFLNVAFGWRPFVSSTVGVCDVLLFAADYIASAERNNNRWLQRRFAEDEITSDTLVWYDGPGSGYPQCDPVLGINHVVPNSSTFSIRRQKMTRVWYEGSFRYYRPEFDRDLKSEYPNIRKIRQMLTLMGLNLNATTIYKVTPWTWLVDWFANVGGNIQAVEDLATNQVASRYMYLMRSTFDRFEYKVTFNTYDGQSFDLRWYKEASVKRRVPASSPFGFTLLSGGLSPFQYAIMAALGITKFGS